MALNSMSCADVPLSNYSLTGGHDAFPDLFQRKSWLRAWMSGSSSTHTP